MISKQSSNIDSNPIAVLPGRPAAATRTHLAAGANPPDNLHPRSPRSRLLHQPSRHLRALLRLSRHRHRLASLVLGTVCASAAAVSGVALVTFATTEAIHRRTEHRAPLAAAKPLAPPPSAFARATPKPHHHFLSAAFHTNPLSGIASWYGAVLHGHKTASGETFQEAELTAAHRTLPFGTLVKVTDLLSRRSVVVRINDRGVLAPDRVIDLSSAAAQELGILRTGLARVKLEVLKRPDQS